jgi:uncharacterized OB-fold protein
MSTPDTVEPPDIGVDPQTEFFWEGARAGELRIQRCQNCKTYIHLPRPVCRVCHSFDLAPEKVSGRGTVYSFTITQRAFHPFYVDRLPYVVAIIELPEQKDLRLVTNLVNLNGQSPTFGMQVEVGFEELAPGYVIPVFSPVGASA